MQLTSKSIPKRLKINKFSIRLIFVQSNKNPMKNSP